MLDFLDRVERVDLVGRRHAEHVADEDPLRGRPGEVARVEVARVVVGLGAGHQVFADVDRGRMRQDPAALRVQDEDVPAVHALHRAVVGDRRFEALRAVAGEGALVATV